MTQSFVFKPVKIGFFARGMPPGVLEPQAGGCIAVPGGKDKKTGPKTARTGNRTGNRYRRPKG
jgi:hypothetical protein